MIMVLNGITWAGIALGGLFHALHKNGTFFMVIAMLSQIVLLAFVIFIGMLLRSDNVETASLILDIVSSPKMFIEVMKTMSS